MKLIFHFISLIFYTTFFLLLCCLVSTRAFLFCSSHSWVPSDVPGSAVLICLLKVLNIFIRPPLKHTCGIFVRSIGSLFWVWWRKCARIIPRWSVSPCNASQTSAGIHAAAGQEPAEPEHPALRHFISSVQLASCTHTMPLWFAPELKH